MISQQMIQQMMPIAKGSRCDSVASEGSTFEGSIHADMKTIDTDELSLSSGSEQISPLSDKAAESRFRVIEGKYPKLTESRLTINTVTTLPSFNGRRTEIDIPEYWTGPGGAS